MFTYCSFSLDVSRDVDFHWDRHPNLAISLADPPPSTFTCLGNGRDHPPLQSAASAAPRTTPTFNLRVRSGRQSFTYGQASTKIRWYDESQSSCWEFPIEHHWDVMNGKREKPGKKAAKAGRAAARGASYGYS